MNILNMLLIPRLGIIAAAFTTFFSFLIIYILSIIKLNKLSNIKFSILDSIAKLIPLLMYALLIYFVDHQIIIKIQNSFLEYSLKLFIFIILAGTYFLLYRPSFKLFMR